MLATYAKRGQSGFSLVELMMGMLILGVLVSVSVPSMRIWLLNTQIRNAAESIQSGLQRARAEAVAQNRNVDFVLQADVVDDHTSWAVLYPGEDIANAIDKSLKSDSTNDVTRVVLPAGANTLTFDNTGRPLVGALNITSITLDNPLMAADDSQDLQIQISTFGKIKMCDPNLTAPDPRACS